MAQKTIKKITLLVALLILGGGAVAFAMMAGPEEEIRASGAGNAIAASNTALNEAQNNIKRDGDNGPMTFLDYDMVMGDKDAPIEIIEYAAISCSHCAHFHSDVIPALKQKYLDTGKAKLIYRNFIFENPFDVFAATLTRCTSEQNFFPAVKTYFDYQKVWNNIPELQRIFKADGREAALKYAQGEVAKIGEMTGIPLADAQRCFADEGVINYLLKIRQTAIEQYQVNSTPTLIVNGKKVEGHQLADLEKAIEEAGR